MKKKESLQYRCVLITISAFNLVSKRLELELLDKPILRAQMSRYDKSLKKTLVIFFKRSFYQLKSDE